MRHVTIRAALAAVIVLTCQMTAWGLETALDTSFENGLEGWRVSPSELQKTAPFVRVDDSRARTGRRSLRVDCREPQTVFLLYDLKNRWPGKRFELTYSFTAEGPISRGKIRETVQYLKRDGKGPLTAYGDGYHRPTYFPYLADETECNGWTTRTLRFEMMTPVDTARLRLGIGGPTGRLWIDDIRVREIPDGPLGESLWYYDPLQCELGKPLAARFQKLYDEKSPFLASADRYNGLLAQLSLARDEAERIARLAHWADTPEAGRGALRRVAGLEVEAEPESVAVSNSAMGK